MGSGKTAVVKLLKRKIAGYFDADSAVHKCYRDKKSLAYRRIVKEFPTAVIRGAVCRRSLREIAFSDDKKLDKLEKIVHPEIIRELKKWLKAVRKKKGIYLAEVPLLFEKKLNRLFEEVILVKAPGKITVARIMKKYGLSRKKALQRVRLFIPLRDKIKEANFIVNNDSSKFKLKKEVDLLWKKINQK